MTQTLTIQPGIKHSYLMVLLSVGLGISASTTSTVSHAAIYKCVDTLGNTTYSSSVCADNESSKRISNKASAMAALDCRVARKFAAHASKRMMAGDSSAELFDSYGGLNATSHFVLNLVSYVYSFDGNQDVSAGRLTTLSTERCESGSFGPVGRQCDAFPGEFIEELGGCNAARGVPEQATTFSASNTQDVAAIPAVPGNQASSGYALPALGEASPLASDMPTTALPAGASGPSYDQQAACQSQIKSNLDQLTAQMRESQGASSQDSLNEQQRELRKQLSRC